MVFREPRELRIAVITAGDEVQSALWVGSTYPGSSTGRIRRTCRGSASIDMYSVDGFEPAAEVNGSSWNTIAKSKRTGREIRPRGRAPLLLVKVDTEADEAEIRFSP